MCRRPEAAASPAPSTSGRRKGAECGEPFDLLAPGRTIAVVATAAIPWMTGTAVNPTLRAAFLARHPSRPHTTLVVPWLPPADQADLFPGGATFDTPAAQAAAIRAWVAGRAGFTPDFHVQFYPGRYDRTLLGVFPVGDLATRVCRPHAGAGWFPSSSDTAAGPPCPPRQPDVVILEEPEHLTWHHAGPRWTALAPRVLGVVHTNYRELAARNAGPSMRLVAGAATFALTAAHTDVAIKLSGTIQRLPRQVTACVHGVAPAFLDEGARRAAAAAATGTPPPFTAGGYALGKVVWGKGWEELLDLLGSAASAAALPPIHAYGDGDALTAVQAAAAATGANLVWHPKADHVGPGLRPYRAFINASTSDVVATTSLEALAMGKWLVCAAHPCNAWACRFSNALPYSNRAEFAAALEKALTSDPAPLPAEELRALGWEAATERLAEAAAGPVEPDGGSSGRTRSSARARSSSSRPTPPRPRRPAKAADASPSPPSMRTLRRRAARAAEAAFAALYRAALSVEAVRVAACAGAGTAGACPPGLADDGLTYKEPAADAGDDGKTAAAAEGTCAGGPGTRLGAAFLAIAASRPAARVRVRVCGGSVALFAAGAVDGPGRVGGGGLAPPTEDEVAAAAAAGRRLPPHQVARYGGLNAPWEL